MRFRIYVNEKPGYSQPCRNVGVEPRCKTCYEKEKKKICSHCIHYIEWARDDITGDMASCKRDKSNMFPVQPMEEACEYFEEEK